VPTGGGVVTKWSVQLQHATADGDVTLKRRCGDEPLKSASEPPNTWLAGKSTLLGCDGQESGTRIGT